ncbi:MAG: 50S ribosomal protein L17 [Spirochaetes bacterium GWB1_36_13]|nr:MAG: 50S ribosomal protein L17 [Spirochaetes bacterium GWB1_36_13]
MRHLKKVKKLKRNASHRQALLMNLAISLINKEKIITTTAKAKALRSYIEKLITKAKNGALHQRRIVASKLRDAASVQKLFEDIALRYKTRNGGYTRVYKMYNRPGDAAEMAMIELVEELLETEKKS